MFEKIGCSIAFSEHSKNSQNPDLFSNDAGCRILSLAWSWGSGCTDLECRAVAGAETSVRLWKVGFEVPVSQQGACKLTRVQGKANLSDFE